MRVLKALFLAFLGAVTIQPLHAQDVVGNASGPQITAAWTSATAQNTVLTTQLTFTTATGNSAGPSYSTVGVSYNPTGSITGGTITFEATTDPNGNVNFQPMLCSRIGPSAAADSTYTLVTGAQVWQCDIVGLAYFRTRLSAVVTGTGTANLTSQGTAASTAYSNAFASTTQLTAAFNGGAILTEKGPRIASISQPAISTQATVSRAAGTGTTRHVADCVSFSAMNTTAIAAAAQVQVNLRDGATGAGTVIWSHQLFIPIGPGQAVVPFSVCGLNLIGSATTAMTLEFSALVTNLFESVALSTFDVQ